MKTKKKKPEASTAIVKQEDTREYWKARAEAVEAENVYREAFSMLLAPFAQFMRERIEQLVSEAVDEAISSIEVESYISR